MTEAVLDASALLAFLLGEPGADKVAGILGDCCISAVNLSESFGKLVQYGRPLDEIVHQFGRLHVPVVPFDAEQAGMAASLVPATREHGLSLGDRACLALAMHRGAPTFTAEREWKKCKLGVEIVTIR